MALYARPAVHRTGRPVAVHSRPGPRVWARRARAPPPCVAGVRARAVHPVGREASRPARAQHAATPDHSPARIYIRAIRIGDRSHIRRIPNRVRVASPARSRIPDGRTELRSTTPSHAQHIHCRYLRSLYVLPRLPVNSACPIRPQCCTVRRTMSVAFPRCCLSYAAVCARSTQTLPAVLSVITNS